MSAKSWCNGSLLVVAYYEMKIPTDWQNWLIVKKQKDISVTWEEMKSRITSLYSITSFSDKELVITSWNSICIRGTSYYLLPYIPVEKHNRRMHMSSSWGRLHGQQKQHSRRNCTPQEVIYKNSVINSHCMKENIENRSSSTELSAVQSRIKHN